jgi:heme-degrading monooxygenase HmoA
LGQSREKEGKMHARKTAFKTSPENIDVATKVYLEEVLPIARTIAGFKGGIALADRSTGDLVSFTLWETEDAMNASVEAANRIRGEAIQKIGAQGPPEVQQYEVAAWEV